ncbi:MAG: FadR family transcriptional regulator [Bryobacterales bacterium]|nr:FadR family transcriptional regulator [Bryobacterales bacterium]
MATRTLNTMVSWIREGSFRPGDRLPSQNDLIRKLGVSRTGIREALQMMAAMQLIDIRPGMGCFVRRASPDTIINPDLLAILLEKEAVLQVIETRRIVEAGTAALAADRAAAEDFWLMEDILTRIDRQIQKQQSVAADAAQFHYAIASATHNAVLAKLVQSFVPLMTRAGSLMEARAPDRDAFQRHELQSHRQLLEVLRSRDPDAARIAILSHIGDSQNLIAEALETRL